MKYIFQLFIFIALFFQININAKSILNSREIVHNVKEFNNAVAEAKTGNVIVLPIGAKILSINPNIATKENAGVDWYLKNGKRTMLLSGKIIKVESRLNTLYKAAIVSAPGDIIELTTSGTYYESKMIAIQHPLTFRSTLGQKPKIVFEKKSLFVIENGGSLALEGKESLDYVGNSVISTRKHSMIKNYNLLINRCDFINLDVNHSFDVISVFKNTFADTLQIKNSTFKTITRNIVALDKETGDVGVYNA